MADILVLAAESRGQEGCRSCLIKQPITHFQHCAGCVQGGFGSRPSMAPYPELLVEPTPTAGPEPG